VVFITSALGTKRLELLRQLAPKATAVGMLVNPNTGETEAERTDVQNAVQALGQDLVVSTSPAHATSRPARTASG
jgi:putative tryptophan/tyrosine transport system substrate-binding protein